MPSQFSFTRRITRLFAATLVVAVVATAQAGAQYFGGNKVQYRTFDFEILRTEHFDVHFYPEEREAAQMAARMAERWRARLGRVLGHELSGRQPLVLYAAHPHFEQTNVIGGTISESTGGVTEGIRRRIVLPLGGPLADTDHVIGHELVHAYQFDITATRAAGAQGGLPGVQRLPLWFVEGMAEYLSVGPVDAHTALWMRDAALRETLPGIEDLDNPEYFPYRWGQAFWSWVAGQRGEEVVGRMLRDASRSGSPRDAIEAEFGLELEEISKQWQAALRGMVDRTAPGAAPATEFGRALTPPRALGGELNVSPALSPDGRLVAFLSERELFSIEIYIADTTTGEVVDRVSRTAIDPHFNSLQFINSAGAWNAAGDRFAFAAIVDGRARLALYDVPGKRLDRELDLPGVDEAFNPTWAPDGSQIAFTGMAGGLTDLFVVNVQSGAVRRLTNDAFADIHPAWAPDGGRIAFATDRFTTNLDQLDTGPYRIALVDPASGRIDAVPGFDDARNFNPQWSPDSRVVYFIADPTGVTNAYRVTLETGELRQSTNLQTGISGIGASSPAITVAQRTGELAFTAYEDGAHRIYASRQAPVIAGVALAGTPGRAAAILPPFERRDVSFVRLIDNPVPGLPAAQASATVEDYRPRLQLDAVGAPSFSVGRDRFGAFGGGGVAFSFSDPLGDHSLLVAAQLNTSLSGDSSWKDLGGAIGYTNLRHRWNWGVFAEQVPYRTGSFASGFSVVEGQPAYVEQSVLLRQTSRSVAGVTAYPFSRAHRVEFTAGLRSLSFDQEVRTTAFSPDTGELILDERRRDPLGETLNLGEAAAALVYDTSVFGATSPVMGQRYRFEVTPVAGSVRFTGLLADYRRYFMPAQFYTIAVRAMHYGRYGRDGEDPRLTPLFIGYPTLVRGYDVDSFTAEECRNDADSGCPAFDRLLGSRTLVGNVELRFPLLRPFGLSRGLYGPVPVEVGLFADAGVAWDSNSRPDFAGGDRRPVSSAGVALRINALGFAVLQLDFVRPFQRPDEGWMFQFSLSPGF